MSFLNKRFLVRFVTKSLLAACPDEGKEECLQWELHDDGRLDLYSWLLYFISDLVDVVGLVY